MAHDVGVSLNLFIGVAKLCGSLGNRSLQPSIYEFSRLPRRGKRARGASDLQHGHRRKDDDKQGAQDRNGKELVTRCAKMRLARTQKLLLRPQHRIDTVRNIGHLPAPALDNAYQLVALRAARPR